MNNFMLKKTRIIVVIQISEQTLVMLQRQQLMNYERHLHYKNMLKTALGMDHVIQNIYVI